MEDFEYLYFYIYIKCINAKFIYVKYVYVKIYIF